MRALTFAASIALLHASCTTGSISSSPEPDAGALPDGGDTPDADAGSDTTEPEPNDPPLARPEWPGIWSAWGRVETAGRPWYKGSLESVGWADVEPSDGTFDWTELDDRLTAAVDDGLYVMAMVYTGDRAPEWLYDLGVPRVHTEFQGGRDYPYYFDATYQDRFVRMIAALAAHLQELPAPVREKLVGVQCPVGASGDVQPYKQDGPTGVFGEGYFGEGDTAISVEDWYAFVREMYVVYADALAPTDPPIYALLNSGHDPDLLDFVAALPGAWLKTGPAGDRYQNNREALEPWPTIQDLLHGHRDGHTFRARSEMDSTLLEWFHQAPIWNMYWTQLWGLHLGQDMHDQLDIDLVLPEYVPGFVFYTRYAGVKIAAESPGAWIALRDGLDASDVERFPEAEYGADDNTPGRYLAIAAAFAADGARQDDPESGRQTSSTSLNDVGSFIHTGNYQMYLTQIDPDGTSRGVWRQGSLDEPYGRFARRLDAASGRNAMRFDLDDDFVASLGDAPHFATLRVVYLDVGTGSWQLRYDAESDAQAVAIDVQKTDTGEWREISVVVSDARFANGGTDGADLVLDGVDDEDDVFHMLEVIR